MSYDLLYVCVYGLQLWTDGRMDRWINGWLDGLLALYVVFNSTSVILGQWIMVIMKGCVY